jgi:predicted DNA-binding transcriptional regulator AlpA
VENKLAYPPQAYTVSQFCEAHGISRALFYLLLKDKNRAPAIMRAGRRVLISAESAAAWRARMTALAQEEGRHAED